VGKKVQITVAVLLAAGAGVLGFRGLVGLEPVYAGCPLSEWLRRYHRLISSPIQSAADRRQRDDSERAIHSIGTNAIPFLLQRLRAHDSPVHVRAKLLLGKLSFVKFHFRDAEEVRGEGASGFRALGRKGTVAGRELAKLLDARFDPATGRTAITVLTLFDDETAIPVLVGATTNSNAYVRSKAVVDLGYRKRSWVGVVQSVLACLTDPEEDVRSAAAFALQKFPSQAGVIVPALTLALQDPSLVVQVNAASSLGVLGEKAGAAAPALEAIVKLRGPGCQAAYALREIDPAAAQKAGVKPAVTPASFE